MTDTPNPGSDAALAAGCLCPVIDNCHGNGWGAPPDYWRDARCPLHGDGTAFDAAARVGDPNG